MKHMLTIKCQKQIVVLCIFAILLFTGCSQQSDLKNDTTQNTKTTIESLSESTSKNSSETSSETSGGYTNGTQSGNDSFVFLKLGISDKVVMENLGEAEEKSAAQVWGADGLEHQTWFYKSKGVELDMVKEEGRQTVGMITITSPCSLQTGKNIGIGSSYDDVLKAYKNEIDREKMKNDPATLVIGTVYDGIIFTFENDKVVKIFFGAAAE